MELRSGARKAGELSLWMSIVGAELDMDWSLLIDGVRCFLSRNDNMENLLLCFGGIPSSSGAKGASVTILSPGWSVAGIILVLPQSLSAVLFPQSLSAVLSRPDVCSLRADVDGNLGAMTVNVFCRCL